MKALKPILISDFTINNLSGYLTNLADTVRYSPVIAPFNQVQQVLLNPNLECWKSTPDFAIVFCQPQKVIHSFNKLLNNEAITLDIILNEVDEFIQQLISCSSRVKFTLLASFTLDANKYYGISAYHLTNGVAYTLAQINNRLAQKLTQANGFYLLDAQRWINSAGANAYPPKLWYLSKIPFHNTVFECAANDINACVKTILGLTKKLIVLDLDDTLWGGIVGDAGWQHLILGGHNALGEAYVDFQKTLLAIANTGVQLAIVSKNEELVALTAIEKHPEMILRKNNFVAHKINWKDKAQNIYDLTTELNIGLDTVVFMDDNPAERARVKEALPQVFVPQMPNDKLLFPSFLQTLNCFATSIISNEDVNRTQYYNDEKNRSQSKLTFQSIDEWLATIDIKINAEPLNTKNSSRITQLFNKTNQLNLSTRRLTEKEITEFTAQSTNSIWAFSLTDKFGDAGLTGILGLTFKNNIAHITDFILSCRVMGRKCEETMLAFAITLAKQNKCNTLVAEYIPSPKNKPCLSFFITSGLVQTNNTFIWDLNTEYTLPPYINFTNVH